MKDKNDKKISWWVRLGCFLTGWNKDILKECSEHSFKELKRVTSAMMVISLIWFFVLYKFGEFYMGFKGEADPYFIKRVACGIIGIILVVQIERQVVLHISNIPIVKWTRVCMAILMALLGSTIFDQIMFKDDIEAEKLSYIQAQVEALLPAKQKQFDEAIADFKETIAKTDKEYQTLQKSIQRKPTIKMYNRVAKKTTKDAIDSEGNVYQKDTIVYKYEYTSVVNPRMKDSEDLRAQMDKTNQQINDYRELKRKARENLEKDLLSEHGFLQELEIMFEKVLLKSWVAMVFWIILFLFMVLLELLVLFASAGRCDYEEIILKQKELNSLL